MNTPRQPDDTVRRYQTPCGVQVIRQRTSTDVDPTSLARGFDAQPGLVISSNYDHPGRYTRWGRAVIDPPVVFEASDRRFCFTARRPRGATLLAAIFDVLRSTPGLCTIRATSDAMIEGELMLPDVSFDEEDRTKQRSMLSVLRALADALRCKGDDYLGYYGAIGYDLIFQFDTTLNRSRTDQGDRDLVLYVPDRILVLEDGRQFEVSYEFAYDHAERVTASSADSHAGRLDIPWVPSQDTPGTYAPNAGSYRTKVLQAKEAFERGDLFEVVLSQMFTSTTGTPPSEVFTRLRERNPSPYSFTINLGRGEFLVGASPEMFVRSDGRSVETCPISGTIRRGANPLEDAENIRTLLNSDKDEIELTMCTDVDRNDKARVSKPGTVEILARRQIELYSRLIHTVDHLRSQLRDECDAWDALLTHLWAVTVTGAPKRSAVQFINDVEDAQRRWYGGAIGYITFDGRVDTGLTLRSVRMTAGRAEVRVGATLLTHSDPAEEEAETRLKAAAMLDAISNPPPAQAHAQRSRTREPAPPRGPRVLLIDHEDSFVHTLADYLRQASCSVTTRRWNTLPPLDDPRENYDLAVLSPGPGTPTQFDLSGTLAKLLASDIATFGVCLGMQGIVEYFGGTLRYLDVPMHGRTSQVTVLQPESHLFKGIPDTFRAGRYHSLVATTDDVPSVLDLLADSDDGSIMAIQHTHLPIAGVQFHPESLLTASDHLGLRLIANVARYVNRRDRRYAVPSHRLTATIP